MSIVSDDAVWTKLEALEAEGAHWHIYEFQAAEGRCVATREPFSKSDLPKFADVIPETLTVERHDFKDRKTAQRYVLWRSVKAAMQA